MRAQTYPFAFSGIWSMTRGVRLQEMPKRLRAELRGKAVTVPGYSGDLWLPENAYDIVQIELHCRAAPEANLEEIAAWLTGFGDLVLGDAPDYCYKARLTVEIPFERFLPGNSPRNFTVKADCQPFRYYSNPQPTVLIAPGSLVNPGTVPSAPIITVIGSGDITLTVGAQTIGLTNVPGSITIDSTMQDAYNGDTLLNNAMSGEFPILPLGRTPISWSGAVSSIAIQPNWRWL